MVLVSRDLSGWKNGRQINEPALSLKKYKTLSPPMLLVKFENKGEEGGCYVRLNRYDMVAL